jgi:hypothetical protein
MPFPHQPWRLSQNVFLFLRPETFTSGNHISAIFKKRKANHFQFHRLWTSSFQSRFPEHQPPQYSAILRRVVHRWAVNASAGSTLPTWALRNTLNSEHPTSKFCILTDRQPPSLRYSVIVPAPPTAVQHPTSIRSKALFMYQHEEATVFRHNPPLELRPFRIARKPCSPNSSDG